jgi:uncharacterized protein YggU (UPF0235/DUF167 family)
MLILKNDLIFIFVRTNKKETAFAGTMTLKNNVWNIVNLKALPINNDANYELIEFVAKSTKTSSFNWEINIGKYSKFKILKLNKNP